MRIILLLAAALVALARPGTAEVQTTPVVRLTSEVEIHAAPAVIWKQLTEGKNLVTWCPLWKSPKNLGARLLKVGDSLDFTDQWGNGGRSVVTFLVPNQELRVAHEPQDASYLCQSRIRLTAAGAMTKVAWIEQYTDGSPEADRNATAEKMTGGMKETLATLKAQAEAGRAEAGR